MEQTDEGEDAGKCGEAEVIEELAIKANEAAIIGITRTGAPPAAYFAAHMAQLPTANPVSFA